MSDWYILNAHGEPVRVDLLTGARWLSEHDAERIVRQECPVDGVEVSTVFLALDHSYAYGPHVPILYETLVFGGVLDGECDRYATRAEAQAGHAAMVERVREAEARAAAGVDITN